MARETIAIFEGLELSAEEARRAIRAHAGAEVIWEWRTGADDKAAEECAAEGLDAGLTFHAGVTSTLAGGAERATVARSSSASAALGGLLWDIVLDAMLAEDAPSAVRVPEPARRA